MSIEDSNNRLLGQIAMLQKVSGYKIEELAIRVGMSQAVLYRRIKNPERFTLGELRRLNKVFNAYGLKLDIYIGGTA